MNPDTPLSLYEKQYIMRCAVASNMKNWGCAGERYRSWCHLRATQKRELRGRQRERERGRAAWRVTPIPHLVATDNEVTKPICRITRHSRRITNDQAIGLRAATASSRSSAARRGDIIWC